MESSSETVVPARNGERVLVIMAKAPRPGAVKTRLTPILPLEAVVAFYGCLLGDTLALARSLGGVEIAIMCPDSDVNELACLAGHGVHAVAQKGEGLAAGLTSVFAHFVEGHQRRIIAFNSDSPHLPRSVLEEAFETLAAHDLVSKRRDVATAKRFFSNAAKQHGAPRVITLNGYPASHRAVAKLKEVGTLPRRLRIRSSKYLNNVVEQDHRRIKQRIRPMLGFKRFETATVTQRLRFRFSSI